ncbi:unnamed protein product, partial [Scytosiphon promiscuus]
CILFPGPIPPQVGNLASLKELYLWGNNLSGPIPGALGVLSNLVELGLSDNQLTGETNSKMRKITSSQ